MMGRMQIELLHRDSTYELVGAVVYSPEKSGMDVGEIAGIGPIGVKATNDVDAALAMEADCVLVNGTGGLEPDLLERILCSGKNVVTVSGAYEMKREPEFEQFEAACKAGGVSLTGGGNITNMQSDVTRIWTRERNNHDLYESAGTMKGFWSRWSSRSWPPAPQLAASAPTKES
jgi:2,4-diaminopentanoate dehydrogenase